MFLFTKEQAEKLVNYYSPILLGRPLTEGSNLKIIEVKYEHIGNGDYLLYVAASKGEFKVTRTLKNVIKFHSLKSPEEILQSDLIGDNLDSNL